MKRMGEWRYSSTFLDLDSRWRRVVSFVALPLYSRGKSSQQSVDKRLSQLQGRSGCCEVEKNLALAGIG
jgi:hypothetical protein